MRQEVLPFCTELSEKASLGRGLLYRDPQEVEGKSYAAIWRGQMF